MNIIIRRVFFIALLSASIEVAYCQTVKVIQTVTTDATINGTADIVLVSSGTNIDLTMPASPATGRVIHIVNHSTDDVSFSAAIRRANGYTFILMTSSPNEFDAVVSTNSITIFYDGSEWRLLNY